MKSVKSMVARTNEEEVLKILSEQAPVGVCIMQDGKFCYVNSNFPIAIGYTVDELLGKDYLEIVVPEDREMVRENTIKMLKGELTSPYQFRVIHKDGSIVWVMATVKSIQYHGRRATLGNYMEITERKQAEEQIRKSERHYRLLAENAEDVIWTVNITCPTRLTYISPSVTRLLGYSVDESMTKEMEAIFTPASFNSAMKALAEEMAGDQKEHADQHRSRRLELQLRHKSGSLVDVEVNFSFIRGANGQKDEILAVARDISRRNQMQKALVDSEEKYKELANSITNVFFAMDEHLRYTYWNKASEILTGIRAEDALGKSLLEIFPDTPGTRRTEKVYRSVLRTQQPQIFVNDYDLDGKHYIFEISAYPSRDGISVFVKDITERKQAEEKLKESEQKYRTILEEMGDGYFETDLAGNITFVNDALIRILGYSKEEIIGMNFRAIRPKEHVKAIFEASNRMYKTGEPLRDRPAEVICKDGRHAFAETSAFPIRNNKGKIIGFRGIHRDITERKQAEERLRKAEEEKSAFLEEAPVAIIHADLDGKITYVNRRFELESGYSREEIIGKVGLQLGWFSIDTTKYLAERMAARLGGSPAKHWETQFKCKDGRSIWIELEGKIISKLGVPVGFQIISNNITERREAEEALRHSEERYRALFDSTVIGMFVIDAETMKVVMANQAAAKMFGFSSTEEAIGVNPLDFVHPEYRAKALEITMKEMFEQDLRRTHEYRVVNKDGKEGWASVTGAKIMHEGRLAGLVSIIDITDRKQAVEALRQSKERYRTMLEEMEDAYFEVDLGGHFTFVNNSVCRDLGYSREELMGMSYKGFTAEDDIESVFRVFNEVYRTGVPNKGFPWKTTRKDGSHGFAETSVSPLRNNKGEIIGFRGVGRDVSERRKMEEALNLQRAYFQQLFDNSPDAIVMLDINDRLIHANKGFEALFGYSAEEIQGRSIRELIIPEEDTQTASASLQRVFSGEVIRRESVRRRKDGSLVDVSVLCYPIRLNDKVVGACFTYTNITQRKQAEEKLRQSEENYKTLFNSSVIGMYVIDAETMKVVMGNRAARELAGFKSAQEGIGINPFDFVVPEDREKVLEIAINEFLQDSHRTYEVRVMDKNGRRRWQSISSAKITHQGRLASLVSIMDITERKNMEEALRQSEENYRALFDSSVIGTIVLDAETMKVVMANQAAAKMFEFSSTEEGIGLNPLDFVPPDDREKVFKIIVKDMFEQDLRQTNELEVVTKNGREIWISATGARIIHEGRLAGLISFTDITEQKRQNERLMLTDRLASLGELAAGTAHELNNPLTSVIGFSQLLMEREVPDDIREDLKLIYNEAQRAASVTNNLLTFARKHAPVKQLTQINNVIEAVLKLRAYEHEVNSIEVKKQLDPNLPEIMVDYFQMQQVFINIIINAEYFMTEAHKRGTLTITTQKQNNTVMISFADDGPGIPPENLKRIFDPFFTTKEAGKGTGLGLSICHGIVTEHNGQIYAKSQLGKGATFIIELPINGRDYIEGRHETG